MEGGGEGGKRKNGWEVRWEVGGAGGTGTYAEKEKIGRKGKERGEDRE